MFRRRISLLGYSDATLPTRRDIVVAQSVELRLNLRIDARGQVLRVEGSYKRILLVTTITGLPVIHSFDCGFARFSVDDLGR